MSHASDTPRLTVDEVTAPKGHLLRKLPAIGLAICIIGIAGTAALAGGHPRRFFFSYLTAFLFWLSFALGGLFFTIVQFASRAGWSVTVRRIAEAAMATLPVFALLFVPILFDVFKTHHLFHWTHSEAVATDHILAHKAGYLNPTFFAIRALVYFALWSGIALWYWRQTTKQDQSREIGITRKMQNASGPAILIFALTVTYASFDWAMSLEPHWYSTIFGVYYFAGSLVAIFALMSVMAQWLAGQGLTANAITTEHFHDLGKFLFAFIVFWAYIAFSQYLLIWYANMPEETTWYGIRWGGGWEHVSRFMAGGHFAFPFFFLMTRITKRKRAALYLASVWMFFAHYVDMYFLVMPTYRNGEGLSPLLEPALLDVTTLLAVGGLFIFAFTRALGRHPLVPVGDPRLPEGVAFENY